MARLPVCRGVDGVADDTKAPEHVGVAEVGVGGAPIVVVAVGVTTTLIMVSSSRMLGVGGGGAVTKLRRLFLAFFF
jgi:hypothetical protein